MQIIDNDSESESESHLQSGEGHLEPRASQSGREDSGDPTEDMEDPRRDGEAESSEPPDSEDRLDEIFSRGDKYFGHANEKELLVRAQMKDAKAIKEVFERSMPWIYRMAKRLTQHDYADLVQEGRIELWEAIKHFDTGRGARFASYAGTRVRRSMFKCLRESSVIKLTQAARNSIAEFESAYAELLLLHSRPPTDLELAQHMETTSKRVSELRIRAQRGTTVSLDAISMGDEGTHAMTEPAAPVRDPLEERAREKYWQALEQSLKEQFLKLPRRTRAILSADFGLAGAGLVTHSKLIRQFEISRVRLWQIKTVALADLRATYSSETRLFSNPLPVRRLPAARHASLAYGGKGEQNPDIATADELQSLEIAVLRYLRESWGQTKASNVVAVLNGELDKEKILLTPTSGFEDMKKAWQVIMHLQQLDFIQILGQDILITEAGLAWLATAIVSFTDRMGK